jgi:hypothetical protein
VEREKTFISIYIFGWEYVVVDIQWYEPGAKSSAYRPFVPLEMDEYSRLIPVANRFPSSKGGQGFKPLADYVHGLGLKFGIHIMRGIPRQAVHANTPILGTDARARDIAHPNSICPWNTDMYGVDPSKQGAQEYYNSLFQLYAEWGVDFIKVDDIASSKLYGFHKEEIALIRNAIDQCGREIVLSLSPGPAPLEYGDYLCQKANMWRITDDFWDRWDLLYEMFEKCNEWSKYAGPGHWPDCDMLPLGHIGIRNIDSGGDRWTRFTKDEQVVMMTLWCICRSPLMFGGELRDNDEWTLSLLTNPEVLEMHRYSHSNRQVYRDRDKVVWAAKGDNGDTYVALFNIGDETDMIEVQWEQLNISDTQFVRDVWQRRDIGICHKGISQVLQPHSVKLLRLKNASN